MAGGVALGCALAVQVGAQKANRACPVQKIFGIEDDPGEPPKCVVPLPTEALRVLARDSDIRQLMRTMEVSRVPPDWFEAIQVHLGPAAEKDLLVLGRGPVMGANVDRIWVLRRASTGWRVVVSGAPMASVEILDSKSHGYHDLKLGKATSNQAYSGTLRFDGNVYKLMEGHWSPFQ